MRNLDDSYLAINASTPSFMSVSVPTDAVDWRTKNVLPEELVEAPEVGKLGCWTRRIVIATAVWSVLELPFEMWVSASTLDTVACVTAKLLWVVLVGFVLAGSRVARTTYGFLCTIGMMALAFGLPVEFRVFPLGFVLSSVECVLKATAFVCLVSAGVYPEGE